jgi:preprotein translocase subunit SecD
VNQSAINGQATSITGNFDHGSATDLAQKLKYGALPLTFKAQQAQSVSATLGTAQLKAGLLAGGIGLVLVIIYSLIYYRALGLVTIASLIVSGGLTYAMLVILGSQIGFVLSLAGIAGFIVAVGITADSFVVFFERIKDEVHEGRSLRVAVPRAWVRARRTILSADTVSFLAAAILYYFAAGDVKGFAFTLGLSTILDLVVVFLFTHPMVSMLSRSRAFGSARFTGLNAVRSGGIVASDDAPAARRKAPARGGTAARAQKAPAAVAVLDDDQPVSDADLPDLDEADLADGVSDEDARPRRRTSPQAGSAAERAAARRARMRDQSGEKEES